MPAAIKTASYSKLNKMLNCFALTVTRLYNDKKLIFSRKQVTTYLLEFSRINTFHFIKVLINTFHFIKKIFNLKFSHVLLQSGLIM